MLQSIENVKKSNYVVALEHAPETFTKQLLLEKSMSIDTSPVSLASLKSGRIQALISFASTLRKRDTIPR